MHEAKTPIASAQLALSSLHGPGVDEVRGDLDRIESRVEQALYYARSTTLSEDFSIEELNLAALARKACRQKSVSYTHLIWESSSKGIGTTYTKSMTASGLFSVTLIASSNALRPPSVASLSLIHI